METRLIDLVGAWNEVQAMLEDPEVDEQTVLDTLEGIEGEIEIKSDGYGTVIRNLEYEKASLKGKKEYLKGILEQITAQEKHLDSKIDWMKGRLMEAMIATGKDEEGITTDKFTFKVKKAGGQQKLDKTGEVPDSFKKIIYEDDDAKIREYLKDHQCDWARLLPRTRYLDIKGV